MKRTAAVLACLLTALPAWGQMKGVGREFRELGEQLSAASQAGDLDSAEELARRRVDLAAGGPDRMVGNAYRSLGNLLRQRGKLQEAEDMLRKALPLIEKDNGRLSYQAIRGLFNLAGLLSAQSRYAEADGVAREALARQEAARPGAIDAVAARNILASVQRFLGRLDEAEALLKAAGEMVVSSEAAGPGDNNAGPYWLGKRRAETRYQLAQLDLQRGRLAAAETHARQALAEFSALAGEAHPDTVAALGALGSVMLRQERYAEAEPVLRQAAERGARAWGRFSIEKARADFNLALALGHLGRADGAEPHYRQALEAVRAAGALNVFAHVAQGYARSLVRRGKLQEAWALEQEVLEAVDKLFAQTRGLEEAVRESFIVQYGAYYFETIELLLQLHRQFPAGGYDRQALAVVSRTQSRVFTEMLRQADAGRFNTEPEFRELRARQGAIQAQLAEQRRARVLQVRDNYGDEGGERPVAADPIVQSRIDGRRQRMEGELAAIATALEQVEGRLWSRYPRYMELTQPRPVTVELLQSQLLKPGETLLTYFLLPRKALAFVVSHERFHLTELALSREEATAMVRAARQPEEVAGEGFDHLAQLDPAVLHRLYRAAFQPIAAKLNPERPVLVIGDGALHTLPLEMLVTRYGEAEQKAFAAVRAQGGAALKEYGTLRYLGQHYRFSYLPSLSALASVRLYRKPAAVYGRDLVSFADPVFDFGRHGTGASGPVDMLTRNLKRRGGMSIPRLPETADEAREIAAVVGGRSELFLRDQAQEHTVKALDLKATRYLHFATHGLLGGEFVEINKALAAERQERPALPETNGRSPGTLSRGEPALLLSLSGELQGEDGLLTMGEIVQGLDLNARLVVLSACNTAGEGAEAAASGEGFAGLTRAFMYAGAQGLLVSHWSVESQATQQLMTETFRHLVQGGDPLAALDQARALIRGSVANLDEVPVSRAHPYFWAPFVYVGDGGGWP